MCFNAFGFGALHMWIFVSAPLCILMALGGQAYGCSETAVASGYSADYKCNDNEESLFFFNNMWQTTIWAILTLYVALHKPNKKKLLVVFTPFFVLAAVLLLFCPQHESVEQHSMLSMVLSTIIWFGSFAYSFVVHTEARI